MTKIAYFQCPTGIAGDMCLGALVHAGVPLDYLTEQLKRLGIDSEYKLRVETVHRQGQVATKVHVDVHCETYPEIHSEIHSETRAEVRANVQQGADDPKSAAPHTHHHPDRHPRHLPDIEQLIIQARLPQRVEVWSLAVFRKLAQAEATVHGIPPEQVHFHEVGATDAIVDVVGTCLGLDWLGIDQV
ncbi:MAG: nickel insertion protein, partial [Microcoleaceae cyanobacterium]